MEASHSTNLEAETDTDSHSNLTASLSNTSISQSLTHRLAFSQTLLQTSSLSLTLSLSIIQFPLSHTLYLTSNFPPFASNTSSHSFSCYFISSQHPQHTFLSFSHLSFEVSKTAYSMFIHVLFLFLLLSSHSYYYLITVLFIFSFYLFLFFPAYSTMSTGTLT